MRRFGPNRSGPAPVDSRRWLQRSLNVARGALCVCFATARIAWADTTVIIGFDDRHAAIPGSPTYPAPLSSYQGLEWHEKFFVVTTDYGAGIGVVSPTNAVLVSNRVGIPARIDILEGSFALNSAWLTALGTNAEVQVQGFSGTTLLYDNTYTMTGDTPTLIQFDYLGVDGVTFLATYPDPGGPTVPGGYVTTWHLLMDDVTVTFIPEPGAAGLFLLGAAVWCLGRRRSLPATVRNSPGCKLNLQRFARGRNLRCAIQGSCESCSCFPRCLGVAVVDRFLLYHGGTEAPSSFVSSVVCSIIRSFRV